MVKQFTIQFMVVNDLFYMITDNI